MTEKQRDSYKDLSVTIDKTEKEIIHLLMTVHDCFKEGKITKKTLDHKRTFYGDMLSRFVVIKEIIQHPRKANLPLIRLREEKGLSQNELAEKVGVSRQWILHLEAGEATRRISKKVKLRVCEVLGISFEEAFPIEYLLEKLIKKAAI